MLREEILRLVDTTTHMLKQIIQTSEQVLHATVRYGIQVFRPNNKSRFTEWEYDCTAVPDLYCKSVKENILDIVTYTQQLGIAEEF